MDGEELDFPSEQLLSCLDMTNTQSNCSFNIDEFLVQTQADDDAFDRTQACTHAHACSPSGPDKTHTHTCIHVHTQIMPASDDTSESTEIKDKKRPLSNREAVRKYRERKKAKAASLEDEVVKLKAINQQLMKRLKNQSLLEAEVCRLKCLLVDIRGRIEGEIGSFPYQKPVKSGDVYQKLTSVNNYTHVMDSCNVQCDDQLYCLRPGLENNGLNGQGLRDCELENLECLGNHNSCPEELVECGHRIR
ncbi:hypothetical protein OROGR_020088 [Orobanche gracilis]